MTVRLDTLVEGLGQGARVLHLDGRSQASSDRRASRRRTDEHLETCRRHAFASWRWHRRAHGAVTSGLERLVHPL